MVWILDRKKKPTLFEDDLLDGLIPQKVVDLMTCEKADEMGVCRLCDVQGRRCHIMVQVALSTYQKYCPCLWWDVFKPTAWKVGDLVS